MDTPHKVTKAFARKCAREAARQFQPTRVDNYEFSLTFNIFHHSEKVDQGLIDSLDKELRETFCKWRTKANERGYSPRGVIAELNHRWSHG